MGFIAEVKEVTFLKHSVGYGITSRRLNTIFPSGVDMSK